jgi:micrococcal nuclease
MSICSVLGLCALTASTISGVATVHDGDTIYVNHQAIRLWGVDAEELSEPNGAAARQALYNIIGNARVVCTPVGASHQRTVARCNVAGRDVGEALVTSGAVLDCARYSGGHYRKAEPAGARARLRQKPYC